MYQPMKNGSARAVPFSATHAVDAMDCLRAEWPVAHVAAEAWQALKAGEPLTVLSLEPVLYAGTGITPLNPPDRGLGCRESSPRRWRQIGAGSGGREGPDVVSDSHGRPPPLRGTPWRAAGVSGRLLPQCFVVLRCRVENLEHLGFGEFPEGRR